MSLPLKPWIGSIMLYGGAALGSNIARQGDTKMNAIRALKVMHDEHLSVKQTVEKLVMMPADVVFLVQILRAYHNDVNLAYERNCK